MIGITAAASAIGGLFGGGGLSSKDQARVNAANSALTKAMAGDASALAYMIQQSNNSATQVGKDAFRAALTQYYNAQQGKVTATPATVSSAYTSAQNPAQQVVSSTVADVKNDIANGVSQLGAGGTNALSSAISGNSSSVAIPTNTRTLLMIGGVIVGAFLILRKHK